MFLSIDFEDFYYDTKRSLGIKRNQTIKKRELYNKYSLINDFLNKYGKGKGKYATFFCTGILAEKEPNLIKKISDDGHEIGCHYYSLFLQHLQNMDKI